MKPPLWMFLLLTVFLSSASAQDIWQKARENGEASQQALRLCRRHVAGWLSHADTETGLLPRMLNNQYFWNAKDCAADNFPFIALTAFVTDDYHLKQAALYILKQERLLTSRVDNLPDTYDFVEGDFQNQEIVWPSLIFGAAEYTKDGLMPMTELLGPGPWLDRMEELTEGIWKNASVDSPAGLIPSDNIEVNGDLLQVMSRLYWITKDSRYKEWSYRLADHYLIHNDMLESDSIALRDHGCEILGGLSETYVLAASLDPEKRDSYRGPLHALIDCILDKGTNPDGMFPNSFNPQTGEKDLKTLSDSWGYVYDAILTVSLIDDEKKYQDAVIHALRNVHKYLNQRWEGRGADGYADSIEGALNLLNRFPVRSGFQWVDESIEFIYDKQKEDGIIEGWYGDGNSARTSMMYALWKTQGARISPWREDVVLGAVLDESQALNISISCHWAWKGQLRLDKPRHSEFLGMPLDYPRINQFPEWFDADASDPYSMTIDDATPVKVLGRDLWDYPLQLKPGQNMHIVIRRETRSEHREFQDTRVFRSMEFTPGAPLEIERWQKELREKLAALMHIDDLMSEPLLPLNPVVDASEDCGSYLKEELTIDSTAGRTIQVLVTVPNSVIPSGAPAVVCIHGHGGDRHIVHDPSSLYHGFAKVLAENGFVTIATQVGQHEVYEQGRTLPGERLWDLMRCVDYLQTLPEVDSQRIGCGGLSLGGEMAMWLAAMDTRIRATSSCGFLTVMDQMEHHHCMCWKFDGLRELADFSDIYGLVAPRALQCQIGRLEPLEQFNIVQAQYAFREIRRVYDSAQAPNSLRLHVHEGEHVVDAPAMLSFLSGALSASSESQ